MTGVVADAALLLVIQRRFISIESTQSLLKSYNFYFDILFHFLFEVMLFYFYNDFENESYTYIQIWA